MTHDGAPPIHPRRRAIERTTAVRVVGLTGLALSLACDPVRSMETTSTPLNTCPADPCSNYLQANDVECVSGRCVVQPSPAARTQDLVAVISMPGNAFYAADQTYVMSVDSILGVAPSVNGPTGTATATASLVAADAAAEAPDAGGARVFRLPRTVTMSGDYEVTPQVAESVNRDLDQTRGDNAALPFHATFRLLWPQAANGLVEATLLGLPVDPVQASVTSLMLDIGPGMGPLTAFSVTLPPQNYVRELVADPPFNEAFGPLIQAVSAAAPPPFQTVVRGYDVTGGTTLPSLTISRADGALDGWTAYLRDVTTNRPVSNVAPLSGSSTSVTFAVKRSLSLDPATPDLDALQDDVLVVAPPDGAVEPTGAFNLFNTLANVQYPALPPFVRVAGNVSALDGSPAAASVTFEKESIVVRTSPSSGAASPTALNTTNLELTRTLTVAVDASGMASYQAILPEGVYRIDVRPTGGDHAVVVQSGVAIFTNSTLDFVLPPPARIQGVARVADGRRLSGATVEAVPAACPAAPNTAWCLPRHQQTVTGPDGSFAFDACPLPRAPSCADDALDPGTYALRVRPAAGSRLPWVLAAQPLVVASAVHAAVTLPPIIVPAPLDVGATLLDPFGNPTPNALVRVFRMNARPDGSAVEVGQALTDDDGSYEMYVAPAAP